MQLYRKEKIRQSCIIQFSNIFIKYEFLINFFSICICNPSFFCLLNTILATNFLNLELVLSFMSQIVQINHSSNVQAMVTRRLKK